MSKTATAEEEVTAPPRRRKGKRKGHGSPGWTEAARQGRLADVEAMMLTRFSTGQIAEKVTAKWGVTPRTVNADLAHVRAKWQAEDSKRLATRRSLVLRRLEHLSGLAAAKGQLVLAVAAEIAIARCLGMIPSSTLVDKGLFLSGVQTIEAAERNEKFRAQVVALRRLEPALRRATLAAQIPAEEAEVVKDVPLLPEKARTE
jgi:hypothetical protein